MKKILSLAVTLSLVFGIAFAGNLISAFASETEAVTETADTAEDSSVLWDWGTYDSGVVLTAYKGTQTDVYVPGRVIKDGVEYDVLKLGDGLFKNYSLRDSLNSVTLGEGITEIGEGVFEGAANLVCIVTNQTLEIIGANAFAGCTSFNSIILYESVTAISENAFEGCGALTVYCDENSTAHLYAQQQGIEYVLISEAAQPLTVVVDSIEYYIGNGIATLMKCDTARTGAVVIPAEIDGVPVTKINNNAFSGCESITSVVIPDTVTYIGTAAFAGCERLETANIPKGLENIPSSMFYSCYFLGNIEIPYGVKSIGNSAFSFCYWITSMRLPESVTEIGANAFWYCRSLSHVNIPSGVTELYEGTFYLCNLNKKLFFLFFLSCKNKLRHFSLIFEYLIKLIFSDIISECKLCGCMNLLGKVINLGQYLHIIGYTVIAHEINAK